MASIMRLDVIQNLLGTQALSIDSTGNTLAKRIRSTDQSQNYAVSNANAITVSTTTPTTIASLSITTIGKPVLLLASGDCNPAGAGDWNWLAFYRDSTQVGKVIINQTSAASYNNPFGMVHIDVPAAGTYTYSLRAYQGQGSITYGETGNGQAPTIAAIEVM